MNDYSMILKNQGGVFSCTFDRADGQVDYPFRLSNVDIESFKSTVNAAQTLSPRGEKLVEEKTYPESYMNQ